MRVGSVARQRTSGAQKIPFEFLPDFFEEGSRASFALRRRRANVAHFESDTGQRARIFFLTGFRERVTREVRVCSKMCSVRRWAARWRVFGAKTARAPSRAPKAGLRGTQRGRETRVYASLMQAGIGGDSQIEWVLAHEALERLAHERAELDAREGLALLRALRAGVHRHLGYASFPQYVEALFGYSPRTTDDKLRTAIALESLPELRGALGGGSLCWSAVRELARVATPATERAWLEAARARPFARSSSSSRVRSEGLSPPIPAKPRLDVTSCAST